MMRRARGENYELRSSLNGTSSESKDAIKRVIANMTIGKDVSGLFPDVLKNMQTDDIEQKKLVYLYLINYAKTQPELVILAVNTFVKDTDDPNPLIRALAIRTMGCLRAEKIIDYLSDPLRKCLRDDNPYVRKTAVIAVAKLYDLKPALAIENGFIAMLQDMVSDSNPMVVANAVTALSEIHESTPNSDVFVLDGALVNKLLVALGECTEWGRIAILSAIAKYRTADSKESELICERVVPQFQHANPSVVMAAIKVIMIHMRQVEREDFHRTIIRKMGPPLVTLVSSAPEVQWVALRNINLILQKRPDVLSSELRVFFCKFNDPPYIKLEKLDIMLKLATAKNVDMLLSELKEYANEVDVDFVRRAVRAIGGCAIKIEEAAERCVAALLELIGTKVSYVVQEAIVVIKDIFRKYPSQYEGIIPVLCSNLDSLDDPDARASLIWIVGEYAEKISNSSDVLASFLDTFAEDPVPVQLQTLSAIVKLFLKRPEEAETQALVQRVLATATKGSDSADVRDRAYVYWRLLSSDPEGSKAVVLAQRPPISIQTTSVSPALLEELIGEISSLASVYHKPVETFLGRGRIGGDEMQRKAHEQQEDISRERALQTVQAGQNAENLLDMGDDEPQSPSDGFGIGSSATTTAAAGSTAPRPASNLDDLLGLFDSAGLGPSSSVGTASTANGVPVGAAQAPGADLMDGWGTTPTRPAAGAGQQQANGDLLGDFF